MDAPMNQTPVAACGKALAVGQIVATIEQYNTKTLVIGVVLRVTPKGATVEYPTEGGYPSVTNRRADQIAVLMQEAA